MTVSITDRNGKVIYSGPERRKDSFAASSPARVYWSEDKKTAYVHYKAVVKGVDRRRSFITSPDGFALRSDFEHKR
jgi:hypothetical protein